MTKHINKVAIIDRAIEEAKRFIFKADLCRYRWVKDPHLYSTKESGAMKRASLDLSRMLTELRKPRY